MRGEGGSLASGASTCVEHGWIRGKSGSGDQGWEPRCLPPDPHLWTWALLQLLSQPLFGPGLRPHPEPLQNILTWAAQPQGNSSGPTSSTQVHTWPERPPPEPRVHPPSAWASAGGTLGAGGPRKRRDRSSSRPKRPSLFGLGLQGSRGRSLGFGAPSGPSLARGLREEVALLC